MQLTVNGGTEAAIDIRVEPWPAGGWVVRLGSTPISHHDTEEEALDRAAAYQRGLEREERRSPPA